MKGFANRRTVIALAFAAVMTMASFAVNSGGKARAATPPSFGSPITLPSSKGGEPSLAIDTTNCTVTVCHMYVVSPNGTTSGPASWHSSDYGATWSSPTQIDTVAPCNPAAGGDTDVDVLPNGSVTATDLNLSWATGLVSNDHGQSFPG